MSTPNFSFSNRCVLITNDDYECGNCPETTDEEIGSRSYPSWVVDCEENDKMKFWRVVITAGYYADQCLDFVEIEPYACDVIDAWYDYDQRNLSKTGVRDKASIACQVQASSPDALQQMDRSAAEACGSTVQAIP